MYTRKINLKELILELDCLDESTVEALENTETGIESYEVEYSVKWKGMDDYAISPTPISIAWGCLAEICYALWSVGSADFNHMTILEGIGRDAEWWEGENRDMLIELSEDRFDDE